jgi:hypothetical protein
MLQTIPKFAVMAIAKDWGVEQISNTEFPRSFYTKIVGFRQRGILQSTVQWRLRLRKSVLRFHFRAIDATSSIVYVSEESEPFKLIYLARCDFP